MGTSLSTSGGLTDSQKATAKAEGLTNTEFKNKLLGVKKSDTEKFKGEKPKVKKKSQSKLSFRRKQQ